jgi:hypothetical protein
MIRRTGSDARDTDRDLRDLYANKAGAPLQSPLQSAHLDEAAWERLACHELTPLERSEAIDHIVGCLRCAQIYRGVLMVQGEAPAFDPEAPGVSGGSRRQGVSRWFAAERPIFAALRVQQAGLATALVASVALAAWGGWLRNENRQLAVSLAQERSQANVPASVLRQLQQRLDDATRRSNEDQERIKTLNFAIEELSQPQLDAPIVDVEPGDEVRGAARPVKRINLPASTKVIMLVLNTSAQHSYSNYGLEMVDARGQVTWKGDGLHKSQYDTFTVAVPRKAVADGPLRLRVYGLVDGRRQLVEEYAVQIRFQ